MLKIIEDVGSGPPLDSFNFFHILSVADGPNWGTVFQDGLDQRLTALKFYGRAGFISQGSFDHSQSLIGPVSYINNMLCPFKFGVNYNS